MVRHAVREAFGYSGSGAFGSAGSTCHASGFAQAQLP